MYICVHVCAYYRVCIECWRAIEGSGAKGVCATFVFSKNGCIRVYALYRCSDGGNICYALISVRKYNIINY